ncbi:MAG TPA: NAD(P)H-binding protein [Candidatus Limnocylindrales bacterium]|nr:NAD(P)H-binding protein [Candidatus Limnocylindrales bacterium]
MAGPPVLVTGATGRFGRAVVAELLEAGVPVRALSRTPLTAGLPAKVEVVAGDLTDPGSLGPALDGVRSVFLLWTVPIDSAAAVIERMASGPRRVTLLSSPHRTPHPFFQQPNPMARLHAEIEDLITDAGLDATFVRPGILASNAQFWWGPAIRAGDVVRWPYGSVETAPIEERDVAAVAARALYEDGHVGRDYVLTGPASLSQAEQVSEIGAVLGRRIRFAELSSEEFRHETAAAWPAPIVDMLLDAWRAAAGQPAFVTTSVADVTGRPARTFREWVADHAGAFALDAGR